MSVFDASGDLFGSIEKVLAFLQTRAPSESLSEFRPEVTVSPLDQLLLSKECKLLVDRFPRLRRDEEMTERKTFSPHSMLSQVAAELAVDLNCSDLHAKVTQLGGQGISSSLQAVMTMDGLDEFPLLTLGKRIVEKAAAPNAILQLLIAACVTLEDIPRLCLPIRLLVRDALAQVRETASISLPLGHLTLCGRFDLVATKSKKSSQAISQANLPSAKWLTTRFSSDSRALVALQYLATDKPGVLVLDKREESEAAKQRALVGNAQRVVGRPIGRGALLMGSNCMHANSLVGVPLNLGVKIAGQTVSMDLSAFPTEALCWPEFHNGVAGLLEIFASKNACTREWILAQRQKVELLLASKRGLHGVPPELVPLFLYRHAGVLFGVGLMGQLTTLRPDDCYRYLKLQNECVSTSIILGRSISFRTSSNAEAAKLCFLHIPALLPQQSQDLDIPLTLSCAALAGLGFVYTQTCNREIANLLLSQIAWKPLGDKPSLEREAYSVSAGLGLGLVSLGAGLQLADKLVLLMSRGEVGVADPVSPDSSTRCSLLFERGGEAVNTTMALPGACLAFGLAYLRTKDESVASLIPFPRTLEQLEKEPRPDSLLHKCLARALVMLDAAEPNARWVKSQIPEFLLSPESLLEARETRTAGADAPAAVDWLAVYQARMWGLTGACLALSLRFAGSRNGDAKNVLLAFLEKFNLGWNASHCAAQSASRPSPRMPPDRLTIETCRAALLLGLSVVMAGSGDLDVLRYIRSMKEKSDESTSFGVNLAVNQAAGFLFLGGGRLSFDTCDFALACILASILPRFPSSVSDNRFTPQVFRHLYVLAVKDRSVEVLDVETGEGLNDLELLVGVVEGAERKNIFSDRHFPLSLDSISDPSSTLSSNPSSIYLLKREGKTSRAADPTGSLDVDRIYISEFTEPREAEVSKLIGRSLQAEFGSWWDAPGGIPLQWLSSTNRQRLSPCELAAVVWPRAGTARRLEETNAVLSDLIGEDPHKTMSEKHIATLMNVPLENRLAHMVC